MALYTQAYYTLRRVNAPERKLAYLQEHRRIIQKLNIDAGFVLDYGCGTGEFLDLFGGGWQKYGVEVSEYAIDLCARKGIHMAQIGDLGDECFDLAVFRGVLQHIDNPFDALRQAARVLKPGGVLAVLAQPDADSLCYRMFHELPALDAPRNWWIPGAHELTNILARLGFGDIEIQHPYRGGPYAHPWRDFTRFGMRLLGVRKPFAFPGNMLELYARKG